MIKAIIKNKTSIKCVFDPPAAIKKETGQPKILTATYNFVPLTITIKERSDNE